MNTILQDMSHDFALDQESMAKEYILGGASYKDIFGLASSISSWSRNEDKRTGHLCLATSSKTLIMAAILSSLGGGPSLVIPASLSDNVIADTCKITGANAVLSDQPIALPKGIRYVPLYEKMTDVPAWRLTIGADKPFLWLYTGGSTGAPKLWSKTPDNIIGEALYLKKIFKITETDILLSAVLPLHIYGLLFSVLLPFVSMARVIDDIPYFPQEIIRTAARTKCTAFIGSPMHYRALSTSSPRMKHLRLAFSSGGFLEKSHSLHFAHATGIGVTEVYGSTETGGIATRCQSTKQSSWKSFSCVRWMIDGERLSVSSPFLSPNLHTNKKGFFTTGDRASDSGNDTFTLHGRTDGIVKIGGKRVDLTAIEQKIKSIPLIMDAWVLSLPSVSGRENDIAVLVVTKRTLPYIRRAFAGVLEPTHMPRLIANVSSIPVTLAGKRDHHAALSVLLQIKEKQKSGSGMQITTRS